ncbi:MAG: hypothetical protein WAU82_08700 [Candidatus Binatus sp.]|uniref:hypothetical protein n=1 Tax=Candidatus Binatus sp. TaxID=2811406 RepID=UPI003BAE9B98
MASGQRGVSTAGSGFAMLHPMRIDSCAGDIKQKDRYAIFRTGAGFAAAKLSEILRCARVARFTQDDN